MISKTVLVLLVVCALVVQDSDALWRKSRRRFWRRFGQIIDQAASAAGTAAVGALVAGKRELDNQENPSPDAIDDFHRMLEHSCPVIEQNYGDLTDDEEVMKAIGICEDMDDTIPEDSVQTDGGQP